MIENIAEFLSDVLGTTEGEITEALKDGENWKSQAEIGSFVKSKFDERLHKAKTASRLEGHGRGSKESLTKKEKELKEKLGVDVDGTIEDIVDAALEAAKTNSKLNPDDVKNSEVYINETKRLKAIITEKEKEISEKESSFAKKETMRAAKELGLKFLKDKNFVLPESEEIREEMLNVLFDKLEDQNTKLSVVDGKIVVLDANGRPKDNETGTKEISYEDLLVSKAKRYFPQAVADTRQSPANKNLDTGKDKTSTIPEMKTLDDLMTALSNEKDVKKQQEIKAHWDSKVKDGVTT